jgi:aspartate/methionine/tyrosine aminotransferase
VIERHRRQGAQGGLVVMDEAYQPFASRSWIDPRAARRHARHVLLMRTLSKFGLAGVRLGYMMGPMRPDRRDRQGAPALQHQRAELPNARCSRSSMPTCLRRRRWICAPSAARSDF